MTLIFRGETLTPDGLSQMDDLITEVVSDPGVRELLTPTDPVIAPSWLVRAVLGVDGFGSVTQTEIDAVGGVPGIGEALDAMTGLDDQGMPITVASIRLIDTDDERIDDAERRVHELAITNEGPLAVSTISTIVVQDEYQKATIEGMAPLVGLAFLLIAVLILLFMRTISDLCSRWEGCSCRSCGSTERKAGSGRTPLTSSDLPTPSPRWCRSS